MNTPPKRAGRRGQHLAYARPYSIDDTSTEVRVPEFAQEGVTIREYFAAAALQGLLASGKYAEGDDAARVAVRHADAVLLELQASGE